MTIRKIPISMNDEQWAEALTLASYCGLNKDVYGWFPKTVRLGINLANIFIEKVAESIPDLDDENLDLFFQSVKRAKKKKRIQNQIKNAAKTLQKYNSGSAESIAQLYQTIQSDHKD